MGHSRVTLWLFQNDSCKAYLVKLELHEYESVGGTHFHVNGIQTRFHTEAKGNPEMTIVYC